MSNPTAEQIINILAHVNVPGTSFSAADIAQVNESVGPVKVTLTVGYPISQVKNSVAEDVRQRLMAENIDAAVVLEQQIPSVKPSNTDQTIPGVKNIIAVASGKGGVGKSTTAANLALALAYEGGRVGLLDADIYGPSMPQMLGLGEQRPEIVDNRAMRPLLAHGIQVISMGNLVTENTPMVWRGPMVSGALKQLLNQTHWDEVDYLVIDMPPGTGDIQLTLSQSVPVSSSIVVTTPQDIALLDAKKGIEMFRKVNIPVVGVVENMAMYTCSNCGHSEAIFGEAGGDRLAQEYDTQVLARLPLRKDIREQMDSGTPPLIGDPSSEVSQQYLKIAHAVAADIWQRSEDSSGPVISFTDE
ncbi:iron-sulfur cluster carrier protein ApbC [Agarilytica rhodophyticola]|uniref:iron-sulfur cluster carrier protein ApbC n=1 Tax=Agarilytica rhodophyticola TaxID=1737490 RepID=UPI000B3413F1